MDFIPPRTDLTMRMAQLTLWKQAEDAATDLDLSSYSGSLERGDGRHAFQPQRRDGTLTGGSPHPLECRHC